MNNIYETITNKIVEAIERSAKAGDFVMPWHRSGDMGLPSNVNTGSFYQGVNIISLWIAGKANGFASSKWATFKQWQERGAMVRKGEKGTPIVFYKQIEREDEEAENGLRKSAFARASWVFNAAQVDGYSEPEQALPQKSLVERLTHVDNFIYATGAKVQHGGDKAFYRPSADYIQMPFESLFYGSKTQSPTEAYYSTFLHELAHWTGHESRLDREKSNRLKASYAFEELIAELSAAFSCALLGIETEPRLDHAQYIAGWLTELKSNNRAIFSAASAATAATNFLAAFSQKQAVAA